MDFLIKFITRAVRRNSRFTYIDIVVDNWSGGLCEFAFQTNMVRLSVFMCAVFLRHAIINAALSCEKFDN